MYNIIIHKGKVLYEPFWFNECGKAILIATWHGVTTLDSFKGEDLVKVFAATNKWIGGFDKMEIRPI